MYKNKTNFLIILAMIIVLVISCSDDEDPWGDDVSLYSIDISKTTGQLRVGEKDTLEAIPRDADGNELEDVEIVWTSTSPAVASVENGIVTALSPGETKIRAESGDVRSDYYQLEAFGFSWIDLSHEKVYLIPEELFGMKAYARDENGEVVEDVNFTWISSDSSIIHLDKDGLITALEPGVAEVHAYYEPTMSEVCSVFVIEESPDVIWSDMHAGMISEVLYSPNGTRIASAGLGNMINYWKSTGEFQWSVEFDVRVNDLAFNSDGSRLAYGTGYGNIDSEIGYIDTADGIKEWFYIYTSSVSPRINSVDVSSDDERILCGSEVWGDSTIAVYNTVGDRIWSMGSGKINDADNAEFHPTNSNIVAFNDFSTVWIYNIGTNQDLFEYEHTDEINEVAFSPDGTKLASVGEDNQLIVYDTESYSVLWQNEHPYSVKTVQFSPDGSTVATGSYHSIILFDSNTGNIIWNRNHNDIVLTLDFSSDGNYIVTGGFDFYIKVWNVASGELIGGNKHDKGVPTIDCHPGDYHFISGSYDKTIKVWDYSGLISD